MYSLESAIVPQSLETEESFHERIYQFNPKETDYGLDFTSEQLSYISDINNVPNPKSLFAPAYQIDRHKLISELLIPAFNANNDLTHYIKVWFKVTDPNSNNHSLTIDELVNLSIDYANDGLLIHRENDFHDIYNYLQPHDNDIDELDIKLYDFDEEKTIFSPLTYAAKEVQRFAKENNELKSDKLPEVKLESHKVTKDLVDYILPINSSNIYHNDDIDFVELVENYTRAELIINTALVNLPSSKEEFLKQSQKLYPKLFEKPNDDKEFRLAIERFFSNEANKYNFIESYENLKSEENTIYRELILSSQARLNYAKRHGLKLSNDGEGNE